MVYFWTVGLAIAAWGTWTIWNHTRECSEITTDISHFGGLGMAAAMGVTLFCGYEIAETAMLTAVSAPLVATYQRCRDLETKEMTDLLQIGRLGTQGEAQIQADDQSRARCSAVMNAYASAGEAILTHGEK